MPHQSLDFEKIKIKSERRDKIRKRRIFPVHSVDRKFLRSWKTIYPPTHTPEQKLSPADWWPWGWRRPAGWWSGRACSSLPVAGESSPHHFQLKRVTISTIKSFSPITNAINERKDGRGTLLFRLLKPSVDTTDLLISLFSFFFYFLSFFAFCLGWSGDSCCITSFSLSFLSWSLHIWLWTCDAGILG